MNTGGIQKNTLKIILRQNGGNLIVVCGLCEVMAIFSPIRQFISVDLPTFGLPINATKPE